MRDLPSSYRYCGNIPLPLRRGRATQHFQILRVAYGLRPRASGSAFLLLCHYDAAVFTLCYGLLPCSPVSGVFTYRFSTRITSGTGYMLHGFLVLPWQDLHLQASVSLAGHTTRMTRMLRVFADTNLCCSLDGRTKVCLLSSKGPNSERSDALGASASPGHGR